MEAPGTRSTTRTACASRSWTPSAWLPLDDRHRGQQLLSNPHQLSGLACAARELHPFGSNRALQRWRKLHHPQLKERFVAYGPPSCSDRKLKESIYLFETRRTQLNNRGTNQISYGSVYNGVEAIPGYQ
jgi:hypothetical protein